MACRHRASLLLYFERSYESIFWRVTYLRINVNFLQKFGSFQRKKVLYEAAIGMVKALKGAVRHNAVETSQFSVFVERKGPIEMTTLAKNFDVGTVSLGIVALNVDVPLPEETGPVLPGP